MKKSNFAWLASIILAAMAFWACDEAKGLLDLVEEKGGDDKPKVAVSKVEVNPGSPVVLLAQTQQFTATVTGTGSLTGVTWKISDGVAEGASINETGLLTVPAGETAETLTVTATSQDDTTKKAEVTVYTSLSAYVSDATEAGTEDAPIPLPLSMALTSGENGTWRALLAAINTADKYFALDLSGCPSVDMGGEGVFNPERTDTDPGSVAAKGKIVSLILPDAATSIAAGEDASGGTAFANFTALKSVSGENIVTIGDHAFRNSGSLDNLVEIDFPNAKTLGTRAFNYCFALTTVSLPEAETIGVEAFRLCKALTTANLPAVTSFGHLAFIYCYGLTELTLPAEPPTISEPFAHTSNYSAWKAQYFGNGNAPVLTIYVPAGSVGGYVSSWNLVDGENGTTIEGTPPTKVTTEEYTESEDSTNYAPYCGLCPPSKKVIITPQDGAGYIQGYSIAFNGGDHFSLVLYLY